MFPFYTGIYLWYYPFHSARNYFTPLSAYSSLTYAQNIQVALFKQISTYYVYFNIHKQGNSPNLRKLEETENHGLLYSQIYDGFEVGLKL